MSFNTFLNNREDLKMIFTHLRNLKKNAPIDLSNISNSVKQRRYVIENYSNLEPNKVQEIPEGVNVKKIKVHGIECEWVTTSSSDPNKRLLYIHGGSFIGGNLDTHRLLFCYIAQNTDVSVLAINYRKAPENPFPAGLEDCQIVYEWMIDNSPNEKSKAEKIFLMGDSAGGNLSASLLLKIKNTHLPFPNSVYLISPALDLAGKSPSVNSNEIFEPIIDKKGLKLGLPLVYVKGKEVLNVGKINAIGVGKLLVLLAKSRTKLKDPFVSPIYGDLKGLPPIYIHAGEIEMLRDDAIRFAEKAKKAGVPVSVKIWPDMIHVFIAFAGYLPEADMCLKEVADSINEYSKK